jgi:predicted acetyltransferase
MPLRVILPDASYQTSYLEAVEEFMAEGVRPEWKPEMMRDHFAEFVQTLRDKAIYPLAGLVPETVLWSVLGSAFIGRVSIRHRLQGNLINFGGHIGYEIRPSERRKGYGTQQLALALPVAASLGIRRVLITCDDDNLGSIRIIEHNGGVLENRVDNGRHALTRRYWISLD